MLGQLRELIAPITRDVPLVIAGSATDPAYPSWIQAAAPDVRVGITSAQVADEVSNYELSDALLIIDPRCLPLRVQDIRTSSGTTSAEPRVSHHLVVFESGVAGTKERVSFDATGQVRKILRHYDPATWSFIGGVTATLLPVASGILGDGTVPTTLRELRQLLALRGVPSRDMPITGGTLNLEEEAGLLAANELAVRSVTQGARRDATVVLLGGTHQIHESARLIGPLVIHAGAQVDANAKIVGPAVIGAGARVGAGAVVVHSVIGPDCVVPDAAVVRNRMWCDAAPAEIPSQTTFSEQLARAMAEARNHDVPAYVEAPLPVRAGNLALKRALDLVVSSTALVLLSPILLLCAAAVRLGSRGPIFYGDKREGVGGRDVPLLEVPHDVRLARTPRRTDLKALDKMDGPHFKLDHDPRVTRVGRVLRALNLDELPQLFNVLIGEMSLVGPRPVAVS